MLTINFMPRFVPAVENGLDILAGREPRHPGVRTKFQTIRRYRKDGKDPEPGDWRALWTGMRTKQCRKLGEVVCTSVEPVKIGGPSADDNAGTPIVGWLIGSTLSNLDAFARRDGLTDFAEMVEFFNRLYGLPFSGVLIRWDAPPSRESDQ